MKHREHATDASEARDGFVDAEIASFNANHKRIRGTLDLKYPPRESRCKGECGHWHYQVEVRKKIEMRRHPCFLALSHGGSCEFSSECNLTGIAVADVAA